MQSEINQTEKKVPEEEEKVSLFQTATQSLATGCRRIIVAGPRGSGKTTFSVSASRFAGDLIPGAHRLCKDVLVVQGDTEGIMGAHDAGLEPGMVLDMTRMKTWQEYLNRLRDALIEVWPMKRSGALKVIVIDLAMVSKLIDRAVPANTDKDWKHVAAMGQDFFHLFDKFTGVTVIGNTQMKVSTVWGEGTKKGANEAALNTADARAIGGERSAFTIDLPKGVGNPWLDHASFIFMRRVRRTKDGRVYSTITQSSAQHEAKSRSQSKLEPTEPGENTLHSLMRRAYGNAL